MEQQKQTELILSNDEFIMLSYLLGAQKIVGISDPGVISQMNESQLEAKWNEIKSILIGKNYIQELEDGLNIEQAILSNTNIYINASKAFELKITNGEEVIASEQFFISKDGIMNISTEHADGEMLKIKTLTDESEIIEIIKIHILANKIGQEQEGASGTSKATLNRAGYYEFMANMNLGNLEKATNLLIHAGIDEALSQDAASGFLNRNKFITFSFNSLKNEEKSQEILMFYSGEISYYGITFSDEDEAVFLIKPLSTSDCEDNIEKFILKKIDNEN